MKKILFITTGSIACFKAAQAVSALVKRGHSVQVVATKSALQFVGAATWEGLTGQPVAHDIWAEGRAMDHIQLIRDADLVIVAPASAGFLNRIASGLADDLASTLFLAHDFSKPFLVAPAMNVAMLKHPVTQGSIAKLSQMGVDILPTGHGPLACGEEGEGRLLEPEELVQEIERRLKPFGPRVLVTSGGTREPIDDVRFIGNRSTGATGSAVAAALAAEGMEVVLLRAADSVPPPAGVKSRSYETYADLEMALQEELRDRPPSHVIHAAAVADFTVEKAKGKVGSGRALSLELQPTPKLIGKIREWSNAKVCGFKLTSGAPEDVRKGAIERVMESAELVVHNDQLERASGRHTFRVHQRSGAGETIEGATALGKRLARWVQETMQ